MEHSHTRGHHGATDAGRHTEIDPVCGMTVGPETGLSGDIDGKTYYFCSEGCRKNFLADPQKYLNAKPFVLPERKKPAASAPIAVAPTGTTYTCPMHPEVRQDHSGSCPICGMALERVMPSVGDGPNPELTDMTVRFWTATALALPVFGLAMAGMRLGLPAGAMAWIQLALATPAVLWAGWPFFVRGWASIVNRNLNMFTLIAMGVGVAWLCSTVVTLAPGLFPPSLREVYFEAAAVITALALLGQVLELQARERTSGAIRGLMDLAPKTARRAGTTDDDVPLDQVVVGDRLRVRPGEAIPVDGTVVEGHGTIDESMVTGESMPVSKGIGDALIGGTINKSGSLVMEAGKVGRDTLLMRIVQMVATAQRSRAPIQRLADQVSAWFVPLVIVMAIAAFVSWSIVGPEPRLAHGLVAAVSVLIIACPCALGLATPMSIMVGVGKGAQVGVLIRDAEALERLEAVDTLVVDKTGTLTEGRPQVTAIEPAEGFTEAEVLRLAASLERASEHPLATAIVSDGMTEPTGVENVAGQGITGVVEGRKVRVGSARFIGRESDAAVLVEIDGRYAGAIRVADLIRVSTPMALKALRDEGIRVVMLTGDNQATAELVAKELGITEIEAGVLPERKSEVIARLKSEGRIVAMAGDGINDAPALAVADVGIAMGTGTDIAMESAGVTLLGGDLMGIVRARRLSRATMGNIRQNLFFAFIYNAAGVPIAAGVLYPVLGLLLSPALAALAMALSSVSVIGNALRLRSTKLG